MKIQQTHFESMDQVELAGEWNFPDAVIFGGRRPVVVLAHNRAGRDRNCNGPAIPHYDGFLTLANGLTAAGFAVFRYDKRGCGKSAGDFAPDDELTLTQDYRAAVLHALSHPDVDDWRVFLLGQSQGTRIVMSALKDLEKQVLIQGLVLASNVVEPFLFQELRVPYLIVCGKEDHAFREVPESRLVHHPVRLGLEHGLEACLGLVLPGLGHLLAREEHAPDSELPESNPIQFFNTRMDNAVVEAVVPWLKSRAEAEPDTDGAVLAEAGPSADKAIPWWRSHFDEEYMQLRRHWEEPRARVEVDVILRLLGVHAGAHLVDLGSGYGRHAIELASRGFAVTAIDLSEPFLAQTLKTAGDRNIKIIGADYEPQPGQLQLLHADVRSVRMPRPADAVISYDSPLGYFDEAGDDERLVASIARLLKVGGRLFVETGNREWLVRGLQERGYSRDYDESPYGILLRELRWDWFRGVTIERRKLIRPDQTVRRSELRMRHYTLSQLRSMFEQHSLDIHRIYPGIHEEEPFSGVQSQRMCLVGRKNFHLKSE